MIYFVAFVVLLLFELLYFRLAKQYNIIDKPNERSSHNVVTIRGGGIIFLIAAIIALIVYSSFWLAALGLLLIGGISLLDDIYTLPNKLRVIFHFGAVTAVFFYLSVFSIFPVYVIVSLYILVIGIINAYNFMDGINGITGLYSLVVLCGLQYIDLYQLSFIQPVLIWLPIIGCLIFLFFNLRKKALCFAGDVGSVTLALWIIMLLLKLILVSGDWSYILFLSIYGVDAILTIIHRLILKQNIFKAHRIHFYQLMANENEIPHLAVSLIYALLQALIIVWLIKYPQNFWSNFLLTCLPLSIIYILLKPYLMKKGHY